MANIIDTPYKKYSDLVKLVDNLNGNNYSKWEVKFQVRLQSFKLWKYIDGPDSQPPAIPVLCRRRQVEGEDLEENDTDIFLPENEDEVRNAERTAISWVEADTIAKSLLIDTVPQCKLHLVKHAVTAKQAWNVLLQEYQSINAMHADRFKRNINTYSYRDYNGITPAEWIENI